MRIDAENHPRLPRIHFRKLPRPGRRVEVRYALLLDDGEGVGQVVQARTLNIGIGGAFIVTPDPLPPGSPIVVELALPPSERRIEIQSEVRWIAEEEDDPVPGMGVRFHGLSEEEMGALHDYFAALAESADYDRAPRVNP